MHTIFDEIVQVPSYALSYLINGDDSGLEPNEIAEIDAWYQEYIDMANEVKGSLVLETIEDETHFTCNPAFGLACDVMECCILILQ